MTVILRGDGRRPDELRPLSFRRGVNRYAEGSVLVFWGETQLLCTASVEEKVPLFLRGTGQGWVTAEYSMLPRATQSRTVRESVRGRVGGRSQEIQRLIGRSLRSALFLPLLGERTIWIDCDVLQADGGTRTAAISGATLALVDALRYLWREERLPCIPLRSLISAVSVGKVGGVSLLDLCYEEDSRAEVDANLVGDEQEDFIEVQATGERSTFSRKELEGFLHLASLGLDRIRQLQKASLDLSPEEEEAIAEGHRCFGQYQQGQA
ncbi:ribonuclease PH [Aminithiophilus ramosus]|uniref:Ribonuclease PH n=1 Tax=Aminithiophilus ramosus TaxID=3029084 RepID=A0A9Q7EVY7_9BACT|nr:ribonuclease PH [Aminithiophilus ramosus]QTX32843.1 ribonuclease PH [Aminithiophilus ramosus]